ncbi:MAG: co-chaperone DjlA [Coxiellaceae bacterium]|nr:co-chaperone DjlA [Coxiellaceae bacterium]
MRFKGKIIGCLMGMLCFGSIGAALGFIVGHLYDIGYFRAFLEATQNSVHTQTQKIFFENTFKIMGYIAKSDGHVSQNEINTARSIMSKMRLNPLLKAQAITLFTLGKQPHFDIDSAIQELRQVCHTQPILLQLFLDIQWQMASADGPISAAKKRTLERICAKLGIDDFQTQGHQYSEQHYRYQQQRPSQSSDQLTLTEAYQLLGLSANATDDAVKHAYRRMMSQHHPDKLIAKGLPPEMIKVATQKTQQIKKAYETIKIKRER